MHTETTPQTETSKKLECYNYTYAFSRESAAPAYDTHLAGLLQQQNLRVLPGGTDMLTSYRNKTPYVNYPYAVVIRLDDVCYLFQFPSETHYIHFMRNFAPLVSIIDHFLPH